MPRNQPEFNQNSHGVLSCANPQGKPVWKNTGGELRTRDINNLAFDSTRGVLYAVAQGEFQVGLWRYKQPISGK